jgi:hypothetical protein
MAKSSWYQQKMLKLRREQAKQRREATAGSIIDESYAEPFRQAPPVANEKSDILMKYDLSTDGHIPYQVLFQLYGLA